MVMIALDKVDISSVLPIQFCDVFIGIDLNHFLSPSVQKKWTQPLD